MNIKAGVVTLSGQTTLQDWRAGADTTYIDGSTIACGSISGATRIQVGDIMNNNETGWNAQTYQYNNRYKISAETVVFTVDTPGVPAEDLSLRHVDHDLKGLAYIVVYNKNEPHGKFIIPEEDNEFIDAVYEDGRLTITIARPFTETVVTF